MKLKSIIVALGVVLLVPSVSYPANWQYVGGSKSGKHYIDVDSIQDNTKNHEIKFWTKAVLPDGSYVKGLVICNYKEKSYISLQEVQYDKEGNVITSYNHIEDWGNKQHIIPDSSFEALLEAALSFIDGR